MDELPSTQLAEALELDSLSSTNDPLRYRDKVYSAHELLTVTRQDVWTGVQLGECEHSSFGSMFVQCTAVPQMLVVCKPGTPLANISVDYRHLCIGTSRV